MLSISSRNLLGKRHANTFNNIGMVKWELALSLFVVFVFVYFALWKGIKSSGKVNFFSVDFNNLNIDFIRLYG